jgi:hypothetical protein
MGSGYVLEAAGKVHGYALRRPAGLGETIGPVVAADEAAAITLTARHLQDCADLARVDAFGEATAYCLWLDQAGLYAVDRLQLMRRGARVPPQGSCRVYALASQALG